MCAEAKGNRILPLFINSLAKMLLYLYALENSINYQRN